MRQDWLRRSLMVFLGNGPKRKAELGSPKTTHIVRPHHKASSHSNDVVLDAFCGCGTALVAAQNLGRQWMGIDISPTACRVMGKAITGRVRFAREPEALAIGPWVHRS
jgi:DNA modification methylase